MRIAVDARIIYTSTGRYIERLLDHLQNLSQDHEYVVLLSEADFDRWQPKAPNFRKMKAPFRPFSFAEQLQFAWLLYRLNCDLVHFTQVHFPLLYLKRRVITVHDLTLVDYINRRKEGLARDLYRHHIKPAVFRVVMWWAVKTSAAIITPTEFVKQAIIGRYHVTPDRINVTPEGVDPLAAHPLRPAFLPDDNQPYLMYLGNAFPYKNLRFLVDAFHQLNRSDLRLVLCGKKEYFYTELERHIHQTGVQNVIVAGFTPDEEAAWLYQHAELFVHPSLSEGFCIPLLEAMYYGAPVLASNASCIPEVAGDGAVYFDPHDQADLVGRLSTLLDNPARRRALAAAGHTRVKHFSWEQMARQTLAVYNAR